MGCCLEHEFVNQLSIQTTFSDSQADYYQVVDVNTDSKPEVASKDSDVLGRIMRHLLPTPAVSPPKATPLP